MSKVLFKVSANSTMRKWFFVGMFLLNIIPTSLHRIMCSLLVVFSATKNDRFQQKTMGSPALLK